MDSLSTEIYMIIAVLKHYFFTFFINTIIIKPKNMLFRILKAPE